MSEDTRRVYTFIQAHIQQQGFPPTHREIARAIGVPSGSVSAHIALLAAQGLIERTPNKVRGLKLVNGR